MLEETIFLADEAATLAFGARLSDVLEKGDVLGLSGPLGAGKTTLARGVIAALTAGEEAPSPTFALVEAYETARLTLWHFDLYRIAKTEEVWELGLEEAFAEGASLIEWPERIASQIPSNALLIRLAPEGAGRKALLRGDDNWAKRLAKAGLFPARESFNKGWMSNLSDMRRAERADFLHGARWGDAKASPLAGDASTRSYERLEQGGRRALLMNAPPRAETAACPPDATPEARRALGYNAMARLAGPNLNAFLAVAETLRRAGLSAPEIYAADPARGLALIEDLGDDLYARAIPAGASEPTLYAAAIDALLRLREAAPAAPKSHQYTMLSYDRTALEAEIALIPEWYWPYRKSEPAPADVLADYHAAWAPVLGALSAPSTIVLRDYHAENLLWLPDRRGAARVGVIDFQDGLVGAPAYDLVSLLEDARRDVPPELAEAMIARYCAGAARIGRFDEEALRRDYAILAAQRNAKILGIFARLIRRDGKPRYAEFFPRVEGLFRRDLQRPPLAPVRAFFASRFPEFAR